jgi:glycosyltransferase involved in cell wall biosynthesis
MDSLLVWLYLWLSASLNRPPIRVGPMAKAALRIVIVSDYGSVNGGAAKIALASARALAERGHEVHFVCGTDPSDHALQHPDIHLHHLGQTDVWTEGNPLRAASRGIWNPAPARHLRHLLANFDSRDTVVHFHQWTKALSPSVIGAAAASGLSSAFTLHDYFLFCPNGIYFDHARRTPCQRRPLSVACLAAACDSRSRAHKAVRVIRQIGSNAALRRVAEPLNLVHVSASAREVARPHFPATARHFVVPNPSTMPKLEPVDVRANHAFVYIGRFTPEKGPAVLARAARAARVPAVFLGEGAEEPRLRAFNPDAELHSWGPDTAVESVLGRARALVFPSLWRETSGLTVLEALSKGVPVICSRRTGAADWVADGINGFLVEPGDVPGLRARIGQLAQDDDLAARLGEQAYMRYWQDAPTVPAHAEHLEAVYRRIFRDPPAGPERPPRSKLS